MTNLKTFLAAVALTAPALAIGSAAHAQVAGIAVADPEAAVANTRAWATAKQQIETTYKAQLDKAEARRQALATELKPPHEACNTSRNAANPHTAQLKPPEHKIHQHEEEDTTCHRRNQKPPDASRATTDRNQTN